MVTETKKEKNGNSKQHQSNIESNWSLSKLNIKYRIDFMVNFQIIENIGGQIKIWKILLWKSKLIFKIIIFIYFFISQKLSLNQRNKFTDIF